MNRKTLLYGGLAAASGLAGLGAAWWRVQTGPKETAQASSPLTGAGSAPDTFWGLSFDTPDGASVAMSSFRGKPLLVNFWATWCPPCVEELPLLDAFYRANKANNWQVLGLAVDQPSAVRQWLRAKPLGFAVGMAGLSGTDLSRTLGNQTGSLPFTVVFDAAGQPRHRKIGKVTPEELQNWIKSS